VDAYTFGYPLAIMDRQMRAATVNTFVHVRELGTPDLRLIIRPNNDTLYSSAMVDLRGGPLVLHVPATHGRYYSLQFMDAYTNVFAYVGRRTTGVEAGDFVVVGPGWTGALPAGLPRIDSPTSWVWILGRTLVDGPEDLAAVHGLQDQLTLAPVAGPAPTLPPPPVTADAALATFAAIGEALAINPPPPAEAGTVARFSALFDTDAVSRLDHAAIKVAIPATERLLDLGIKYRLPLRNGWAFSTELGAYGTDYGTRAAVAKYGLAANKPEEGLYMSATVDGAGKPLSGARRYELRFPAGGTPPVDAFWSVTLYGDDGFLVANPLARYSIGDRTRGLTRDADGGLTIRIQHEAPEGPEANWLPAPASTFNLVMRAYQPRPELLDGTYVMPPVVSLPVLAEP
jgi:hypothetical protein